MVYDRFGRRVKVGDAVSMTGVVESLTEDNPGFVNVVVLLDQQIPPAGTESRLNLNTTQVTLTNPEPVPGEEPAQKQVPLAHKGEEHHAHDADAHKKK